MPQAAQIFGRRDSRETQKALRFFKERRVEISFVDLARRAPAPAELRRFSQRFGSLSLLDSAGRAYSSAGLAYMRLGEEEAFERMLADPRLLRLPLVRWGARLSVGVEEDAWRAWLGEGQADRSAAGRS